MNTRRNKSGGRAGAGGWLHLAATPTFAVMALVTVFTGSDPAHMLCGAMGHGSFSLDSMTFMYLLMAIFHAAPWWKRIAVGCRERRREEGARAADGPAIASR
ncbi:MAG TPA: hypothetical protein VJQ86_00110 [Rhodanobacteraceae bacterium]|nr:hypothetical protein [Rhodanobacteraceae bacterium]